MRLYSLFIGNNLPLPVVLQSAPIPGDANLGATLKFKDTGGTKLVMRSNFVVNKENETDDSSAASGSTCTTNTVGDTPSPTHDDCNELDDAISTDSENVCEGNLEQVCEVNTFPPSSKAHMKMGPRKAGLTFKGTVTLRDGRKDGGNLIFMTRCDFGDDGDRICLIFNDQTPDSDTLPIEILPCKIKPIELDAKDLENMDEGQREHARTKQKNTADHLERYKSDVRIVVADSGMAVVIFPAKMTVHIKCRLGTISLYANSQRDIRADFSWMPKM
jgi:hypothetical protein